MTYLSEIGTSKGGITNPARICNRHDRMVDSAEISGKDDSVTNFACKEWDQASPRRGPSSGRWLGVRGGAPETQVGLSGYSATIKLRDDSGWRLWYVLSQVSADLCGHSVQRWLGTISIDTMVMMTPRSGVSVDDDEIDSVGGKVGGVDTSVQCVDYRLR
ncbi:uncharacterized protein UHOD_11545 [Ustilago sp. UG-2017b]|nr:uncharacterized protein UHOD_11545 [Ustilago sp. UG-2017b]